MSAQPSGGRDRLLNLREYLDQLPRQQAHAAKRLGRFLVDAVQRLRVGGRLRQIDGQALHEDVPVIVESERFVDFVGAVEAEHVVAGIGAVAVAARHAVSAGVSFHRVRAEAAREDVIAIAAAQRIVVAIAAHAIPPGHDRDRATVWRVVACGWCIQ